MSVTINVELSSSDEVESAKLKTYLEEAGAWLPAATDDENMTINLCLELKAAPRILGLIEMGGYFKTLERKWYLQSLNTRGLVLYFVSSKPHASKDKRWSERFVFIPMDNILAIHIVDDEFLDMIREHAARAASATT